MPQHRLGKNKAGLVGEPGGTKRRNFSQHPKSRGGGGFAKSKIVLERRKGGNAQYVSSQKRSSHEWAKQKSGSERLQSGGKISPKRSWEKKQEKRTMQQCQKEKAPMMSWSMYGRVKM